VYKVLNSAEAADSETSKEAPREQYELHRVGQGIGWPASYTLSIPFGLGNER
jgi:hypothetical protein